MNIGVIDINGAFTSANNNFVYGLDTLSNASISKISTGTLATFSITDDLKYPETIQISTEKMEKYANLKLNVFSFGLPGNVAANISTQYLINCLPTTSYTIGSVSSLTGINPGKGYDISPFVDIYEPYIAIYGLKDFHMEIKNLTGGFFAIGEVVTQLSGAKGIIQTSNATHINVKRLTFNNLFNLSQAITGESTGSYANLVAVAEIADVTQIGMNANVSSNVQTAEGSVSKMEVYDSGFGYLPDETVSFLSADNEKIGTAKVTLGKKGISEGFYSNKKGQLSDSKYISEYF
jgi:acetyltransferase-like isoleucine patch superfamily enzyme